MRKIEDNLLKIADRYEKKLNDGGYDDCFGDVELADTFKEIMEDYKQLIKTCKKEGIDVGSSDVKEYKEEFETSTIEEKEIVIDRIKDRILSLINVCENIPAKIGQKYIEDTFNLIDDEG